MNAQAKENSPLRIRGARLARRRDSLAGGGVTKRAPPVCHCEPRLHPHVIAVSRSPEHSEGEAWQSLVAILSPLAGES